MKYGRLKPTVSRFIPRLKTEGFHDSRLFLVIPSPYLWDKNTSRGARPVKDQLKIEHGDRSVALQRALTDFGTEESFGQAAKRFEEHYGWSIDRATVRREVEKTAYKAHKFAEIQLFKARLRALKPLTTRSSIEQLLVELDGCHIQTGTQLDFIH